MNLVRYGLVGQEKHDMLNADGGNHDLSRHITDVASVGLSPGILARITAINPKTLRQTLVAFAENGA